MVRAVLTDGGLKVLRGWRDERDGGMKILSEVKDSSCTCLLEEWGVGFMSHFTQLYF